MLKEERLRHIESLLEQALSDSKTAGVSLSEIHEMIDMLAEGN
jgi:GntR family transcriptional regulator